ncbi:MAG: MMPL family transporter [Acidimicrobiales bacterium]
MLMRLGATVARRRWVVLAITLVGLVASGFYGGDVASRLSSGGFEDPNAESTLAVRTVDQVFHSGQPNLILLVTAEGGDVDEASVVAAGTALTNELAESPGVVQAGSYWTLASAPPLASKDRSQALVLARLGGDEDAVNDAVEILSPRFTRSGDGITVAVGGYAEIFRQVSEAVTEDLAKAEAVAIPITMALLVVVFGSVVAAGLPVGIGILAILGTFVVLKLLSEVTQVTIFSLNLTTAMGLGLAIDYSLFVVSRFREELAAGREPHDAVAATVATAGRTVIVSAATVAVSLSALLVFPLTFLKSFAYAGVAVVAVAGLVSVVVLPAVLAALGHRIDKLTVRRRRPAGEGRFWHAMATRVMRRPLAFAIPITAFLLLLGVPFLHVELGQVDDRVLPPEVTSRQVSDAIRTNFNSNEAGAVQVVASGVDNLTAAVPAVHEYAAALSRLEGVSRVDALTGIYVQGNPVIGFNPASLRFVATTGPVSPGRTPELSPDAETAGTWFSVVPSVEPLSPEGEALVADIRATDPPFDIAVGGFSAQLVDSKAGLLGRIPLAAAIVGVITFVVLFLMFGSVLVPIKAVLLNLLSLTATFGALVWIFQDGNLADVLGFTPTGAIEISTPILMFCIAFGLSMDYEVFLLSRIKEEYDRTGDNTAAVAAGLERTGGIVTAAAALLAVVFIAMATSGVTFIKIFGLGLTMAVLMDATLIRATLVPAFMRLAGDANWWAPAPLRRLHSRFGISEAPSHPGAATGTTTSGVGDPGVVAAVPGGS